MQHSLAFLTTLETLIRDRLDQPEMARAAGSYTASLAAGGTRRMAQKVGEEAVELAVAAVAGTREETLGEAADLVYHLMVLLNAEGLQLAEVVRVLESRHAG